MSRIALIQAGVVANVIEASVEFAESLGYDHALEAGSAGPGWLLVDGVLVPPDSPAPAVTLDDAKRQLRERASALRWQHETGGIDIGGVRVLTGTEDQNRIASALIGAPATLDFKSESGWVTLTLAELQGIAAAIAAHVQACFSTERVHHEAIDLLETREDIDTYDVESGWPS